VDKTIYKTKTVRNNTTRK